jgi:hypothetical protein
LICAGDGFFAWYDHPLQVRFYRTPLSQKTVKLEEPKRIVYKKIELRRSKVYRENDRPHNLFGTDSEFSESLWQYVQTLSPETIAQLSKPESQEVFQVMERNIIGLLGNLPSEHFGVTISTSREHLGRLLASAMMSGYFLRNAEQRMNFEKSLASLQSGSSDV